MTTATETSLTIKDEPTREVILLALWRRMADPVGESHWYGLAIDAGHPRAGGPAEDARAELDDRLAALIRARAQIKSVETASLGDTVSLEGSTTDLVDLLRDLRQAIEENADEVFRAEPDERMRVLIIHDAATALLLELEEMA